jgi:hypothetical protein
VTLLVAGAATAAAAAPPTAPPGGRVLHYPAPILDIAADGDLVAVNRHVVDCDGISIWNPLRRHTTQIRKSDFCEEEASGSNLGALAGTRVLWEDVLAANTYSDVEGLIAVPGGKPHRLYDYESYHDRAEYGPATGYFAGDGSLLAYAAWTVGKDGSVSQSRIVRVDGNHQRVIRRFRNEITDLAVDAGRIAVADVSGTVSLLRPTGSLVRTIAAPAPKWIALDGSDLAVAANGSLAVYDAGSGRLVRRLPFARGSQLLDLANGVAAVVRGPRVEAISVRDGRILFSARPKGYDPLAQIEPIGFYYGYTTNGNENGYVVFVPSAALRR